jgi:RimJ/RimL family protein N-acetyltransferase
LIEYIIEPRKQIKDWVQGQIQYPCGINEDFYRTLGAVKDGQLIGGVIFHDVRILPHGYECEITTSGKDNELWLTPKGVKLFLTIAFVHIDCVRIVAAVHPENKKSINLIEKFGFVQEGRLRDRCGPGEDILIYGMLRRECKWLKVLDEKR